MYSEDIIFQRFPRLLFVIVKILEPLQGRKQTKIRRWCNRM